jgi:hypothetical protein
VVLWVVIQNGIYIIVISIFVFMSVRWGKKYVDARDWKECNQKLVDRGSFLLDHGVLEKWKENIDRLNLGKFGRPFEFPNELFYWAAMQHVVLGMPYRQIQGYLKQFFRGTNMKVPDYTTLFKRIRELDFDVEVVVKKKIGRSR